MVTEYAAQGDTLDLICWRHYGRTRDIVERVLAVNPGLAALGAVLPLGTPVRLPEWPAQIATQKIIQLWD